MHVSIYVMCYSFLLFIIIIIEDDDDVYIDVILITI